MFDVKLNSNGIYNMIFSRNNKFEENGVEK